MYGAQGQRRAVRGRLGTVAAALAVCGSLVMLAAGCGPSAESSASGNYRVGVVLNTFTNPAIKSIATAIEDAAKSKYPGSQFQVQSSDNLQDQIAKAETMISSGVQALGLEPWDAGGITPVLEQAKRAGIPVFLIVDDVPGAVEQGLAAGYIGVDETEGGKVVAQALSKELGGKGKVAILEGAAGDAAANQRTAGFLSGIQGTDLDVVASADGGWARDQGLKVATDMLTAHPDLTAIFAENDEMAFGARSAIQAAGKDGQVVLAGYNGTCTGLQATMTGQFQIDGILYLGLVGTQFVNDAVAILNGGKVAPREYLPFAALTTQQLQDVRSGKLTDVPGVADLRPRLEAAESGNC
jgi:ribose transport system substrate-binding protein